MKAVVPVAGIGKRLRPLTHTQPKVLIRVGGKPILGYILDSLKDVELDEVIFITGHLGEMVEEWVRKNYDIPARFIRQEERLGLGHAIYLSQGRFDGEPAFIVYGDTVFEADLSRAFDLSVDGCLGVKEVEDPRRYGIVELGEGQRISRLVEKPEQPSSSLAIVGVNFIGNSPLLFDCLKTIIEEDRRTRGEFQLTDALQLMVERGACLTTFPVERWFDCGKQETLLETNRHLLEKTQTPLEVRGSTIIPPVYLDPTATVHNSVVGPWVSIAGGAVIRNCIVSDTIIDENAVVENLLLTGSLVGEKVVLRGKFHRLRVGDSSEMDLSGEPREERSQS